MSSRFDRTKRTLPPAPPPPAINRSRTKSEGKAKSPARRKSRSRSKSRERYLRTHNTHNHAETRKRSRSPPPPPRIRSRSRSPGVRGRPSREHDSGSRGRPSATVSRSSFSGSVGTPNSVVPSTSSHSTPAEASSSSRMATATTGSNLLLAQEFSIVRAITNPEDVRIPRRLTEGIRPIFDRPDLKEAMRRRMQADDNEVNVYQQAPPAPVVEPPSQRVVAIIREPVDYLSLVSAPSAAAGSVKPNLSMGNPSMIGIGASPGFNPSPPMPSRVRSPPTPDELRVRRMSPGDRGPDRIAERGRDRPSRRSPERGRERMRSRERPAPPRSRSVGKWVRERSPARNPSPPGRLLERHRDREREHSGRDLREVHLSPPVRRDSTRAEHSRVDGPTRFNPEPRDRHVFVDHHEVERRAEMMKRSRPRSVSPVLSRHPPPRYDNRNHEKDLRNTLSRPPKFQRFEHGDRSHRDTNRGGRGRGRGFAPRGRRP